MNNYSLKFLFSRVKKPTITKQQAQSKVCQEIFVSKIGSDPILSSQIVFKGGLIIDALSKGQRGFTKDIDFDFVKYPLSNHAISSFVAKLNESEHYSNITISIESISELRHKNYRGKRVCLAFTDGVDAFALFIDIGVYLPFFIKNASFKYSVAFGETSKILVSPIERMIFEKLSTFAIYGTDNSRDKDYFDWFFLIKTFNYSDIVIYKMIKRELIIKKHYYRSMNDAVSAIKETITDDKYMSFLKNSEKNWLHIDIETINKEILCFLEKMNH